MPRPKVVSLKPGNGQVIRVEETVAIQLPGDVAAGAATRFFGIEAAIRNAATVLEGDPTGDALRWIADEVERLYCDLDISTWSWPSAEAGGEVQS